MNFDAESYYHKTDYPEDTDMVDEANNLIDSVEDAISNLSYFSVRHDDMFADQVSDLEEDIKQARRQL
jgi:hypothetical protein